MSAPGNPMQQVNDIAEVIGVDLFRRPVELHLELDERGVARGLTVRLEKSEQRAAALGTLLAPQVFQKAFFRERGETIERFAEKGMLRLVVGVFLELLGVDRF